MSIFDRLKSNLSGSDAAAPVPAASEATQAGGSRFMGRDDSKALRGPDHGVQQPVEKGLEAPGEVWVFVCPNTQRLIVVSDLGVAQGETMNSRMVADMQRTGLCEEVSYHAGYDQYWKMPTQDAILRMPVLQGVECQPPRHMKLTTQLVKPGAARGFWMRVRLREDAELPQPQTSEDSSVG